MHSACGPSKHANRTRVPLVTAGRLKGQPRTNMWFPADCYSRIDGAPRYQTGRTSSQNLAPPTFPQKPKKMVREKGLEPLHLAALEPKSSASANSATRAKFQITLLPAHKHNRQAISHTFKPRQFLAHMQQAVFQSANRLRRDNAPHQQQVP